MDMDFITRCPVCHTSFRVTAEQLLAAEGKVRCGACQRVFAGRDCLTDTDMDVMDLVLAEAVGTMQKSRAQLENGTADTEEGPVQETLDGLQLGAPATVETTPRKRPAFVWTGLCLFLASLLIAQACWWFRDPLAFNIYLRPAYERLCETIGCRLPEYVSLEDLSISAPILDAHPTLDQAGIIKARLINHGPFAQPFPPLELRFTDMSGKTVAARRLHRDSYLEAGGAPRLPAGAATEIAVEILRPGSAQLSYSLTLAR